jgi:hypothetical protein
MRKMNTGLSKTFNVRRQFAYFRAAYFPRAFRGKMPPGRFSRTFPNGAVASASGL